MALGVEHYEVEWNPSRENLQQHGPLWAPVPAPLLTWE